MSNWIVGSFCHTNNSKNIFDLVLCAPGTFDNRLGPCASCLVGTYQPQAGQTRCLVCGNGQTTPNEGIPDQYQCTNSGKHIWDKIFKNGPSKICGR